MKKDWLFQSDGAICNFRTAGILIRDDKILVQRDRNGTEYALPGGHVAVGETSAQSLVREFQEETGADIVCKDLLFTEECFWQWNHTFTHTLAFYYRIALVNQEDIPNTGAFVSQKDNCAVVLGWLPLAEVQNITLYPHFLKDELMNLPKITKHYVSQS